MVPTGSSRTTLPASSNMSNEEDSGNLHKGWMDTHGGAWGSFWNYPGVIWGSSRDPPGSFGLIWGSYGVHLGIILEFIWGSSGDHLGIIRGSFGRHLGIIQGSSGGHAGIIWGSSGCHSGVTRGHFGQLSRANLGFHCRALNTPSWNRRRIVRCPTASP